MSTKTTSVSESARVFLGGVGVVVLTWLWWHGYVFRPFAEPVAVAISGGGDPSGKVGSGEFADLLAKMLTGALWAFGEILCLALTVFYRFTRFLAVALVKWLLSFTEAGREYLGHLQDDADASAASELPPQQTQIAERLDKHRVRLIQVVSTVNKVTPRINTLIKRSDVAKSSIASIQAELATMQAKLDSLAQAKSFAAWQKSLAPEGDE